ncbi:uncharacterized protein MELLADRAFT_118212 [Melampsora larici-populina 98AG31]|uniref:Uncharacterized protein n=1 Tax=Melampsora larici-populina (strain 98AG31 / pathotype 3-4-7) TaxID=747676 RepID=F4S6A6_MELLP|nr:uncharacterized protein MELLADRAFT_118212 [Melampsora larici-populina 98AG31]EGF99832.1 hypothetical protein MELLADRAFT_118212 [Melampsora larici-populina 98AG31]
MLSRQSRIHHHHSKLIQTTFSRSFHSSHHPNEQKPTNPQINQPVNQPSLNPTSNQKPVQSSGHQSSREPINKFTPPNRPHTHPVSSPPFANQQNQRGGYPNQPFPNTLRDSRYPFPNQVTPQAYQNRQAPFPRQGAQWQPPPRPIQPSHGSNPAFQNFQGPYHPQRNPSNVSQQGHFNPSQNYRHDPNMMYNQSQPQRPPFPGQWRGPPNPQIRSMNPAGFQARAPGPDPEIGSPQSSSNVLSARRKSGPGTNQAYSLDLNDVSGLHTIDRFVGNKPNQSTPLTNSAVDQSTGSRPAHPNQWNPSQYPPPPHHYFQQPNSSYGTPGYRGGHPSSAPSAFAQPPPTYRPPMREGSGFQAVRGGGMSANRQGGRGGGGGGIGRGRGRGNGPGMLRGRGRGSLFNKNDEPSLPPPPHSILNSEGKFGEDLNPSGCPYGEVKLSSDKLMIESVGSKPKKNSEVQLDLRNMTTHQTVLNELLNSSVPIRLPGFENPIRITPLKDEAIKAHYSMESLTGGGVSDQIKRDEVVGRARKLVSQNGSMALEKKKQAVGVVEFLLMSSKERVQRVV